MGKHYRYAPSSAERWMNCFGSIGLCATVPAPPASSYAEEGTVAHAIAEAVLTDRLSLNDVKGLYGLVNSEGDVTFEPDFAGPFNYGAYPVTETMLDAVETFVMFCRSYSGTRYVECKFNILGTHFGGTTDCAIVCGEPGRQSLIIADFKYGAGVPVEVEDNPQLMCYLLGAVKALGINLTESNLLLEMAIVQPRAPHPRGEARTCRVEPARLARFEDEVKFAIEYIELGDIGPDDYKVGDWCRWCPAQSICPAKIKQAQALALIDFADPVAVPVDPGKLDAQDLANILRHAEGLRAWLAACEAAAKGRMNSGETIPGFKLVQGRAGNRAWYVGEDEVFKKLKALGFQHKDAFVETLLSPSKVEEKAKKWANKKDVMAAVNDLTARGEASVAIAPEEDPRQEYKPAITDFASGEDWGGF